MILIPILGIFLFSQQALMRSQEEAFPLLPNTLVEGRMTAFILEDAALEAHAAACIAAKAELFRLRDEEIGRSQTINPTNPRACLKEALACGYCAFQNTLTLPPSTWRYNHVRRIIHRLHEDTFKMAWNGNALPIVARTKPIFWLQPMIDGDGMLVNFDPDELQRIIPEQLLGLLIWYATSLALEETIAAAYDLTMAQVKCLVTGNRRLRPLFDIVVNTVSRHNYGVWLLERDKVVPRVCESLHDLPPGAIPSYGVSLSDAFVDLPLYCPTGRYLGQRIDPLCMLGTEISKLYEQVANRLDKLKSPEAIAELYRLSEPSANPPSVLSPPP